MTAPTDRASERVKKRRGRSVTAWCRRHDLPADRIEWLADAVLVSVEEER